MLRNILPAAAPCASSCRGSTDLRSPPSPIPASASSQRMFRTCSIVSGAQTKPARANRAAPDWDYRSPSGSWTCMVDRFRFRAKSRRGPLFRSRSRWRPVQSKLGAPFSMAIPRAESALSNLVVTVVARKLWRGLSACHAPIHRGILGFSHGTLEECPDKSGHGRLATETTMLVAPAATPLGGTAPGPGHLPGLHQE